MTTEKTSQNKVLRIGDEDFYFVKSLGGRGQALGEGTGIYQKRNRRTGAFDQFIIKFDPPGTCLGECMVVKPFASTALNAATLQIPVVGDEQKPCSVQPFVKSIPFDTIALGQKRLPKNPFGQEAYNMDKLEASLRRMTSGAKREFAEGIYLSQLNGDESLHTGQFLSAVNSDGLITHMTRIDLGALGRYAVERDKTKDYHLYQTSKSYADKPLKDYIGYYVGKNGDLAIKTELYKLWSETDVTAVSAQVSTKFDEQMAKFEQDPYLAYQALYEFNKTLCKKSDQIPLMEPNDFKKNCTEQKLTPTQIIQSVKSNQTLVKNTLIKTTEARCSQYKANAAKEYKEEVDYHFKKIEDFTKSISPFQNEKRKLLKDAMSPSSASQLDYFEKVSYLTKLGETFDVVDALPGELKGDLPKQLQAQVGLLKTGTAAGHLMENLDHIQQTCIVMQQHAKARQEIQEISKLQSKPKPTPQEQILIAGHLSCASLNDEIKQLAYLQKLQVTFKMIDVIPDSAAEKGQLIEKINQTIASVSENPKKNMDQALADLDLVQVTFSALEQRANSHVREIKSTLPSPLSPKVTKQLSQENVFAQEAMLLKEAQSPSSKTDSTGAFQAMKRRVSKIVSIGSPDSPSEPSQKSEPPEIKIR